MEMDDLFEKHLDGEGDGEDMENGGTGEIDGEWEEDDDFSEHQVDHTEHRPADNFGTSGHDVHNQSSTAGNRQVHGHGANTLNQTRPPKGPSQTGKRTITTASKRTSGDAFPILFLTLSTLDSYSVYFALISILMTPSILIQQISWCTIHSRYVSSA
jgi:hypothetical protein